MDLAVEKLINLKSKFPNVIPRIIALTDGEDNYSNLSSFDIARRII